MAPSESESKSQTEVKSQVEPAKSPPPEGMTPKVPASQFLLVSTAIGVGVIIFGMAYYYYHIAIVP